MKAALMAALFLLPALLLAQDSAVPTMDHEPHHHLVLHNDYVKVFDVRVSPGDSIILHRHDQNTVAIAIGDQLVTVGVPGKPDVHSKNLDAQVRLQRSGYVHSTHVDGDTPYHTVAVELMQPQSNFHNVCGEVLAAQPLHCPGESKKNSTAYSSEPLLESAETQVLMVRVVPHQSMKPGEAAPAQLIVALDPAMVSAGPGKGAEKSLQPGDFVWIAGEAGSQRLYRNQGNKEARFIEILFPRAK